MVSIVSMVSIARTGRPQPPSGIHTHPSTNLTGHALYAAAPPAPRWTRWTMDTMDRKPGRGLPQPPSFTRGASGPRNASGRSRLWAVGCGVDLRTRVRSREAPPVCDRPTARDQRPGPWCRSPSGIHTHPSTNLTGHALYAAAPPAPKWTRWTLWTPWTRNLGAGSFNPARSREVGLAGRGCGLWG
jgi:hypothetical protein